MRYSTVITGDETTLLTTVEEQLNLPTGQDSNLLQLYIGAARDYIEKFIDRGLIQQTVTLRLDYIPASYVINAKLSPIVTTQNSTIGVEDVTIWEIGEDGTETDISAMVVYLDTSTYPNRIYLDTEYELGDNPIGYKIIYQVGQADITDIDSIFQNAIILMVAEMYSNRENPSRTFETLADKILRPYRVHYYE